jgi:hypothetical protein
MHLNSLVPPSADHHCFLIVGLYSTKLGFSLLTSWITHHLFGWSKHQIYGLQFLRLGPEYFFQNQWLHCPPVHYSKVQRKYVLNDSVQQLPVKPWTWYIGQYILCFICAPAWPSKWPAINVHLLSLSFFVSSTTIAKRWWYGPYNINLSYTIVI